MGLLLLKGILLMISDAGLCKTVFKTSSTAGKINFSLIVGMRFSGFCYK
ncbi:unnamed protein product [Acanthoscelides obtectus]|uniref:Uncharacterized protein n=1 Tax=Acanthoscelides obtectus TaxID=200917 RepID=A0A9P0JU02_ACAOB|nr:unnamed protein product [Acanthoscelides obtectus]CAK1637363.1 hypothetical protein AOBTE_LOCUS9934 [Acanthoscelides obtectus]